MSTCMAAKSPVECPGALSGPVPVGPVLVSPVLVGPVLVGPGLVGPGLVGPVLVGPVRVGPVLAGPLLVGPAPVSPGLVSRVRMRRARQSVKVWRLMKNGKPGGQTGSLALPSRPLAGATICGNASPEAKPIQP